MKFIDSHICQSNLNCMNCRFSPVRKKWFEKYEVPEDIEEKCARGKTIEEIKAEHVEIKKKRKEKDDGLGNAYEILSGIMVEDNSKKKFIESAHCTSKQHCHSCKMDKDFRKSIAESFEWDGNCPDGHFTSDSKSMPSTKEKAVNLAKAAARRVAAAAQAKKVNVSDEVYQERYAKCKKNLCGYMRVDDKGKESCGKCGCPWQKKLRWATESCPLDYWKAVDDSLEDTDDSSILLE